MTLLLQVLLVVVLCGPPSVRLNHLCHDGVLELGSPALDGLFGLLLLSFVVVENSGAVLAADINSLSVNSGRIMVLKKNVKQL